MVRNRRLSPTVEEPESRRSSGNPYVLDLELSDIDWDLRTVYSPAPIYHIPVERSLHSPFSPVASSNLLTTEAKRLSKNLSHKSRPTSWQPPLPEPNDAGSSEETKAASTSEEGENEPVDYPTGFRLFVVVLALILGVFLVALDLTIVATAIPKITDEFHGLRDVSWYGAAFFMTTGSFQSTWGKAFNYFPLKIVFLTAMTIFEVGSLVCGAAPSSTAFIVGRAVAGLGAAGVGSGVYIIVGHSVKPQRRPAFTGILGAAFGLASVIGPLLGGVFSETVSWRWCFYINLPIGGLSFFIILLLFKAPKTAKPQEAPFLEKILQMDPGGTAILMGAITCFILGLQYGGQEYPWSSSQVIGLLAGTVALVLTFGVWEYWQGERAMMIPRLLSMRAMLVTGIVNLFLAGSYMVVVYYLPVYFQSIQGTSPIESSVRNLPFILSVIVGTISAGVFVTITGHAAPLLLGSAAIATIGVGMCYTFDLDTPQPYWIGIQVLAGLPLGIGFQIPVIIGQASVDPADLSPATAMQLFCQLVGGTLFVSAGQSAFVNRLLIILPSTAPDVPAGLVVATGAGALRETFTPEALSGVLLAYMGGIKTAFALSICGAGIAFIAGTHLSWKRLNTDVIKEHGGAA